MNVTWTATIARSSVSIRNQGRTGARPTPRPRVRDRKKKTLNANISARLSRLARERKTHKHKQICGIAPGLGGRQNFLYVVFFFGSFLMGEKKHINKVPPPQKKSRDNPAKNLFACFLLYVFFFFAPKLGGIDEGQITHLICARLKYDLYDFFRGCFWAFSTRKRTGSRPKTPPKKSYRSYFKQAQIR